MKRGITKDEERRMRIWLKESLPGQVIASDFIDVLINTVNMLVNQKQEAYHRHMIGADLEINHFWSQAFDKKWEEWLLFRKKHKMGKYAEPQRTIEKLKRLSGGDEDKAFAILDQSMENRHQGLYPLKEKKNDDKYTGIKKRIIQANK
jgi:hypothetical protein